MTNLNTKGKTFVVTGILQLVTWLLLLLFDSLRVLRVFMPPLLPSLFLAKYHLSYSWTISPWVSDDNIFQPQSQLNNAGYRSAFSLCLPEECPFSALCFAVSPPSLNDKVNPPCSPLREPPARPLPLTPELQGRPTKGPICTVWAHNAVISVRSSRRSEGESHPPAPGQCRPVGWARELRVLVIRPFFHDFLSWKSHLIHSFIIKRLCFAEINYLR